MRIQFKADVWLRMETIVIRPKRSMKYLGIWLEYRFSDNEHMQRAIEKTEKAVRSISRILPNVAGPKNEKVMVLYAVMETIIMYGAPA